ncbi:hypothetical protein N5K37_29570 [Delftia tsuruhatensis]|uniref:Peptidase S74 domain-containing protein n=1 Tax=Delftia tsuruhatensis TaxID=180282 RepID=A0ABN4SSF7_9BURK|nr:hypothetical protein [Delftia tsuruhatensis]AOV05728.1 hypothetical protein BI380_32660 [Delftia tsuruhatensis]MDH2234069.1 hypothetical protein [Delftia tsuruhatensis]
MFGFQPGRREAQAAEQPRLGFRPRSKAAAVAQAQNQAPDSIPAMVKPGEFVLPPDTVHAMGGAGALQAAVDATHTPAPEQAFVPRGFKPKAFFANGGAPEDQIPLGGYPKAPTPDGSQSNPMNTELGRNVSNLANAVPGALGGSARAIARTGGAISGAINSGFNAPRALAGGAGIAGSAAASPPAAASTGANPTPSPAPATADATPQATPPAVSTMGPPSSAAPQEIQPGIFRQGNSFADSAQGAALGNEPRGLPSRRNDAAGENLASQYTARGFTPGQRTEVEQPRLGFPGFRTPTIAHSGNDWQSRNDLRNAEVSASSITNTRRFGGRGAENSPDMQRYRAMLGTDAALRQAQPGMEAETMRQNAGLMREDMQQAGGLQREAMQQAGETGRTGMRVGIEQQRLQGEAEARGFKTRAQRQEEQLRNTLLDPNATPQQKQQAQQSMRAIRGDADPSPWALQVTPATKNADGSTTEGSVIRYNKSTGDVQRVDGGNTAQPSANHIAALRANPGQAAMFDEIYGKGSAARVIAPR